MRMRPIHGVAVAGAVGVAAAFGASAIKDTTHLGAAANTKPSKNVDAVVKERTRKLDAQAKALHKARRAHPPKLPAVPAAPHIVPSYSYVNGATQTIPVAAPPAPKKAAPARHITLTRVVHRHAVHTHALPKLREPEDQTTTTTTTTTEEAPPPTTTTVGTTSQPPVTQTNTSTVSQSDDHGDDSHETGSDDSGGGSDS